MSTFLLDTSVIIDVLNDKKGRSALLRSLLEQGHALACCSINISEVYAGMRPNEETATQALLESLDYLDITWEIARQAGLMRRDYVKKGHAISLADATLATVALQYRCLFVTDNRKHFPMKELNLYPLDH